MEGGAANLTSIPAGCEQQRRRNISRCIDLCRYVREPYQINRVSRDELHILSRNAQKLAPSVVVAIGNWIETNRKKQVAGFTSLRFTSYFEQ